MEKVIVDGKVAVLFSPGYGEGWHTWGAPVEAVFDPELVKAVLVEDYELAEQIANQKWPDVFAGGVTDLEVEWLPQGTAFRITEYDGYESVEVIGDIKFLTA